MVARRLGLLLLLVAGSVPACGRQRTDSGGPGGTLVYVRGKDSPTADPALATDGESAILITNVFDTLVRFKYGGFETEPALATSWEVSADARTWTFRLREGVKFHDGTPCDAQAVALSFERQRDEKNPYHFTQGRYPYWGDMFGFVSKIAPDGASTVRFELSEPAPPFFLQLLAMFSSSIVSPTALAKGEKFVLRNPVGTGPFRFVSWKQAQEIVLEANPDWYGGKPKLARLVLQVKQEPHDAYMALEAGQVDGIDNVAARDVERARANALVRVVPSPSRLSVCYLSMQNEVAPFDDVRVRRAVALAIDKARLARTAYEGIAAPVSTLVPSDMDKALDLPDRVRDVEAAKRLLKEAGASGAKVRLHFPGNPRPYLPDPDTVAVQIREDLREIGLEVDLRKEEWGPHLALMQNGGHQLGILGWSPDVADADNYLYVLLDKEGAVKGSANNVSFYRSEAFHEKVAAARRTADPAERTRLYQEAQRIAFEDVPLVPLVAMPRTAAVSSRVKGFLLDPIASPRFAWTCLEEPAR
jgi:peptide/nickel transport system substrate-binding protein